MQAWNIYLFGSRDLKTILYVQFETVRTALHRVFQCGRRSLSKETIEFNVLCTPVGPTSPWARNFTLIAPWFGSHVKPLVPVRMLLHGALYIIYSVSVYLVSYFTMQSYHLVLNSVYNKLLIWCLTARYTHAVETKSKSFALASSPVLHTSIHPIAKLQHAEYQRNKHCDLHKKRPRTEEKILQFSI